MLTDRLRLPAPLVDTPELRARRRQLQRRIEAGSRSGGTLFGDLTKGGHPAEGEEFDRLGGPATGGVPRGLDRCTACGDWRGDCLGPDVLTFGGMVMTVHCRCANHNRCAACGDSLYERRLNANYFNVTDGNVWHVPGFCGLNHACAA